MHVTTKKPVSMPDAFVILFFVMIAAAIASHLIPAGYFQMLPETVNAAGETVKARIDPNSFQLAAEQNKAVPLFGEGGQVGFLNYAFEGLVSGDKMGAAIGVIAFILLTGGAFGIIMKTGAVNNGILALIAKTKDIDFLFIPLMFLLFSLGGAVFGMGEEAIAFCIVLLPLMLALGYDAITTVLVTYIATQIGFATSWMNPFSVAIAQGIAGLPLMSGADYRIVLWLLFTLFGIVFTMRYAAKIKKNPELSVSFESDQKLRAQQQEQQSSSFWQVGCCHLIAICCRYYLGHLGCGSARLLYTGNCHTVFCFRYSHCYFGDSRKTYHGE